MSRENAQRVSSVYDSAWQEAYRHKWIESEKHGRDLGQVAIHDWSRKHFKKFYRWCHWLHLTGRQRFLEFASDNFGTVRDPQDDVGSEVVRLFCNGHENLEIYCDAHGRGWPLERVFELLLSLDINNTRPRPPFA
jgi:hypothetical protein